MYAIVTQYAFRFEIDQRTRWRTIAQIYITNRLNIIHTYKQTDTNLLNIKKKFHAIDAATY